MSVIYDTDLHSLRYNFDFAIKINLITKEVVKMNI